MHDDGRTTVSAARRWARLRAAYAAAAKLYRKEATDDHAARLDRARFALEAAEHALDAAVAELEAGERARQAALDAALSYSHAAQLGQGGEA